MACSREPRLTTPPRILDEFMHPLFLPRACVASAPLLALRRRRLRCTSTMVCLFALAAVEAGIPSDKVFVENKATNTGENIAFSKALLAEQGITPRSVIVVQKPFMERRSFATFLRQWPEPRPSIAISSPNISFENYPNGHISREVVTNIMVGDLQRIKVYATPEMDFQIPQEIPPEVWAAYEGLVASGFTWNVIASQ